MNYSKKQNNKEKLTHITEVRPLSIYICFCVSDIYLMMADLDS